MDGMTTQNSMTPAKWGLLYLFAGFVDILQLILNFFAVGIAINRFIDVAIGIGIPGFLHLNGIKISDNMVLYLSIFLGEQIPLVDSLPLWTLEVWRLQKSNPSQAQASSSIEGEEGQATNTSQDQNGIIRPDFRQPLNKDGVRQPPQRQQTRPLKQLGRPITQDSQILRPNFKNETEKSSDSDLEAAA